MYYRDTASEYHAAFIPTIPGMKTKNTAHSQPTFSSRQYLKQVHIGLFYM